MAASSIKRVKLAIEALRPSIETTSGSVSHLEKQANDIGMSNNSLLAWTKQQIDDLRQRQRRLIELAEDLEKTVLNIDARNRAQGLIKLAGQAEHAGDVDDAISKYKLALQAWPNQPKIKQRLDQLQKTWSLKGPEHEEARNFVYQKWAQAQVNQLESLLPEVRKAFEVFKRLDDYLSATKLTKVNGEHLRELTDIVELLAGRNTEKDRQECTKYEKLTKQVVQLQLEVVEYLKNRSEGGQSEPPPTTPASDEKPAANDESGGIAPSDLDDKEEPPINP